MFDGFMSRCTTLCSCANARPRHTCSTMSIRSESESGSPERSSASRSAPGSSSIAMNGTPRSSPSSYTVTMFGCCSRAAALASISKRCRFSSSSIPSPVSVLTATSRSSVSSSPR
jgi:hypothetical protein